MEITAAIWIPTLLAISSGFLYWFLTRNFNYWKDRGIPGAPALPLLGTMGALFANVMHEVEMKRYKMFGKVHGLFEGSKPIITVADPDILKNILVKDFHIFPNRRDFPLADPIMDRMVSILTGEDWKRVRTIITPTFSTGKIKKMTDILLDSSRSLSKQMKKFADSKESFDAKKLCNCFAMDVIASAAFGTKIDSLQEPNNKFVVYARKAFTTDMPWRFILFFMFPRLIRFLKISIFPPDSVAFFRDVTLAIIEERKKSDKVYNDFLQLLIDAANEAHTEVASSDKFDAKEESMISDLGHEEGNEFLFKQTGQFKSLSHNELVAQSIIFFLAGFHTTALTLSYATYLLTINPEKQEKLIEEVDNTIKEYDNTLTYDAIQSMKYLDKVVWETLRMFPPLIRTERQAVEDYELGVYNYTIPKGMIVGIPVYAIHHDPEYYPDPEKFDPERFNPEEKNRRHPYTYLPFGAGPRNCVGMRFALMEIKTCLAYLLSQYRFKKSPKTKVPLEFFNGQGFIQSKEVALTVEIRQDKIYFG